MVDDKKDSGQVDADVEELDDSAESSQNRQHTKVTTVPPMMRTK
jgi:hypothetical protein